jgi:hypothetical protein
LQTGERISRSPVFIFPLPAAILIPGHPEIEISVNIVAFAMT